MTIRFPAEWEPHRATWIAWPHYEPDWPGKLEPISWVYVEIIRHLAKSEVVEVLCNDDALREKAAWCLQYSGLGSLLTGGRVRFHVVPYDRTWLRDSAPTFVRMEDGERSELSYVQWQFRAWANYDNFGADQKVPDAIRGITGTTGVQAMQPGSGLPLTLEGGAIETDGQGTLLTTEECLLSEVQARNPGMTREGYEETFRNYLGCPKTIWLGRGCAGDDTHGHVDDIARFVAPGKVVLSYEADPADENHQAAADNLDRLRRAVDSRGKPLEIILLPMPSALYYENTTRLPASYANFYIANTVVLVPTFNDPNDRIALNLLQDLFPMRKVIGIHAVDLVAGFGTLHCLSQQEPKG